MKLFRNTLITLVVLALIVFFAIPYGMGWWLRYQYPSWVQLINTQNPGLTVTAKNYHRGFFHSKATLVVNVDDKQLRSELAADGDKGLLPLSIDVDIAHGAFIFAKAPNERMKVYFARAIVQAKVLQSGIHIESLTQLEFNHTVATSAWIEKLNIALQGASYAMENATVKSHFSMISPVGQSQVTIPKMTLLVGSGDDAATMTATDFQMNNDFHKIGNIVYGKRQLSAGAISVQQGDHKVAIKQASLNTQVTPFVDTTDIALQWSVGSYKEDNKGSGPLRFTLSLGKMNTRALDYFLQQALSAQGGYSQPQRMVLPLMKVLSHGVEANVKLNYDTGLGPLAVTGSWMIPESDTSNPFKVIQTMTADVDASAPTLWVQHVLQWSVNRAAALQHQPIAGRVPAVQQAQLALKQLVSNKMLIVKDDMLSLKATFEDGGLLVNGIPPDFSALKKAKSATASSSATAASKTTSSSNKTQQTDTSSASQ